MTEVLVRARTRAAPPAPPPATPHGYPVIGGPARPTGLPHECCFPSGAYIFTEGRKIRQWPFLADSNMIGTIYVEGSSAIHAYLLDKSTWKYIGKFANRNDARSQIERRHEKLVPSVQRVAPPPRSRPQM